MHGIILIELKNFITSRFGEDAWTELLASSRLDGKIYLPLQSYPDKEVSSIIEHASGRWGRPVQVILGEFGEFIAPNLLSMHRALVKREWRTLDLIENTEQTIHRVVRITNAGARPPELVVTRVSSGEVLISYSSERKMCSVVKGIVEGVARHFNERVSIGESTCMLRSDPVCTISVRLRS